MHIIIDATTTQDQFSFAGVGQYTKNVTLSLIKNYPSTQFSLLLFNGKESTLGNEIYKLKNVEVVDIGKYRVNDYKNDIWYYTKILPIVKKIRRKDSIYFCPYFWRNYPSNIMPTVLFVHDMNLPLFNMYSQQSAIHNFIRKIQYWSAMNKSTKCKYILCNSNVTKNDYLKYYPKYPRQNIGVTYLGIDLEEKECSLDNILPSDYKERGYLIYMGGGINRSKNSIGVLKGYSRFVKLLQNKKPPYLVVAGGQFRDKTRKELQELYYYVEEEGLGDNVLFIGFYEDKYKYSLLRNSFAFIHLSLYEGFGVSVAESLRAKTPAILHSNPVYEEIFGDVAVMVNGNDEDEIGSKMLDIYKNPEKYKKMIEEGYKKSLTFTWGNCAKNTHLTFEKVLQK